jgi:hypothetical protein
MANRTNQELMALRQEHVAPGPLTRAYAYREVWLIIFP